LLIILFVKLPNIANKAILVRKMLRLISTEEAKLLKDA